MLLKEALPYRERRVTVAITLPEDARQSGLAVQEQCRAFGYDIVWNDPQEFRMTLKNLGDVTPGHMPVVQLALAQEARITLPFPAGIWHGPGVLAPNKSGRKLSVWLPVIDGAVELKALFDRIEHRLEREGFPRETHPFSPHITLGRLRSIGNLNSCNRAMRTLNDGKTSPFVVSSISLWERLLTPTASTAHPLVDFPFASAQSRGQNSG